MVRWDPEAYLKFTQPVRQLVLMVLVLVAVAIGSWVAYPSVAPVFLANPWLNGFIAVVFVIGIRLFLAGLPDLQFGELDRGVRPRTARIPLHARAAASGAACRTSAVARQDHADRCVLDPVDPRLGRHTNRRGARYHALHRQPPDFPWPSRDVLRACDDGAGGGRDHSLARTFRERDRHGGVRAADDRSREPARRHGGGVLLLASRPCWLASGGPSRTLRKPRAEPVLPPTRGMALLDHPARLFVRNRRGGRGRLGGLRAVAQ